MMAKFRTLFALLASLTASQALAAGLYGQWRVSFDAHPGGPLPFTLDVRAGKAGPQAWLVNAPERLRVEQVDKGSAEGISMYGRSNRIAGFALELFW